MVQSTRTREGSTRDEGPTGGPLWRRTVIFLLLPHEEAVNRSTKNQTDRCCEVLFFLSPGVAGIESLLD